MDFRVGVTAILVLASILVCDARSMAPLQGSDLEKVGNPFDICALCEDYTKRALSYLDQDKTRTQIIEALQKTCLDLPGLANQCTMIVNYYIPMFFTEVSSIKPEGFCRKVRLCKAPKLFSSLEEKIPCDVCHKAMDEALEKLNDPNTEIDVMQTLLQACDAVGGYSTKCKSLVFAFGPLILVDAGKFIENVDLCTTFHACHRQNVDTQQESVESKIEMVTSS